MSWHVKHLLIRLANRLLDVGEWIVRIVAPLLRLTVIFPIKKFGGFFFHMVLVNLYRLYFFMRRDVLKVNPLGKATWVTVINNRQSIHISIAVIALLTFATNVMTTRAENYAESTALATMVEPEIEEAANELIVETAEESVSNGNGALKKSLHYVREGYVLPQIGLAPSATEKDVLSEQGGALVRGGSAIIKQEVGTTELEGQARTKPEVYVVQPGDTVTAIAHKFGVTVNTILWENNLTAYSIIKPGKELVILPATGLTHKVAKNDTIAKLAKLYQVEPEAILEANGLTEEKGLTIGQIVFVPEGLKPKPTPAVRYYQPSRQFVAAPRGGNYIWPTASYRITQYMTWRHFGLDIGNRSGEPIYASADGEVVISSQGKWNGGYGNQVVIDHGNGVQTRYAHNSYNLVKVGDRVTQGQPIAAIGSTGRSSGPHVHFEIMIEGRRENPLNYLKR